MRLSRRCERSFSPFVRQAGDALFKLSKIESIRERREGIDLGMSECVVRIDWSCAELDGVLLAHCSEHADESRSTSKESETGACRHLWAAIRFLEDTETELPGKGRLQIVDFDTPVDLPVLPQATLPKTLVAPEANGLDWRTSIERADTNVARDGQSEAANGSHNERTRYWIEINPSRQAGGWIISTQTSAPSIDGTTDRDTELVDFLNEWGPNPLPTALADAALARLCATGRLFARKANESLDSPTPVLWDTSRPVRFHLSIERDIDQNGWALSGRLRRDEEEFETREALGLFPHGKVLYDDRILQLDPDDPLSAIWTEETLGRSAWFAPQSDEEELLEVLSHLRHPPRLSLPESLDWAESPVKPDARVRIHLPQSDTWWDPVRISLFFRYGSQSIAADDPRGRIPDAKKRQWILRDSKAEKNLRGRLADELSEKETVTSVYPLDQRDLRDVLSNLLETNWFVEAEGRPLRAPTEAELFVHSDQDWFELRGRAEFGNASASLSDLLGAIRSGERLVRLHDGTSGMIPEDWISRYLPLSQLNILNMLPEDEEAEQDDDLESEGIRFSAAQAGLLDIVLRSIEEDDLSHVETSDSYQQLRREQTVSTNLTEPPLWFRATLRGYQKEGLAWMRMLSEYKLGGCLADDMGLGKTVQVLALLSARRESNLSRLTPTEAIDSTTTLPENSLPGNSPVVRRPSLVVVPRSLVFNWSAEARRFAPELELINYTGPRRSSARPRFEHVDLILTTYGVVRKEIDWLSEVSFDYVILDEATAIKNAAALTAKSIRQLQAERRLALTGTPIENHLGELWSLFEFLNPGFGKSLRAPLEDLSNQDREMRRERVRLLGDALSPFILRRTKTQVLSELPTKTEMTVLCDLEPEERKLYKDLERHCRDTVREKIDELGAEQARIHVLTALLRLRQAACHPGLIDPRRQRTFSTKTTRLVQALEELVPSGHKILVFSQFVRLLQIVRRHLDQLGIEYEYLDGKTPNRGDRVRRFQEDPDCPVFLISLKAGGYGLNLTAADYVFLLDPWWNPAIEAQAIDRAHRMGQERPVFAYRLIARGTVEERMLKVQAEKRELAAAVVGDSELRSSEEISKLSTSEMQAILDPGSIL